MRAAYTAWIISCAMAVPLWACGSKTRVEVNALGDAAVPYSPGNQGCGQCPSNTVCLLGSCSQQCQRDSECPVGKRCLVTDQGNGCVDSQRASCNGACLASGTVCDQNECRTPCGRCAPDQVCRGSACYGIDPQHDQPGGLGGSGGMGGTSGMGGYGGSGAMGLVGGSGGMGGSGGAGGVVDPCVPAPPDPCGSCVCSMCPEQVRPCASDSACVAIKDCVARTACVPDCPQPGTCPNDCYQPGTCQGVIDSGGGLSGAAFGRYKAIASCARSECPVCNNGQTDGGGPPTAAYWRFEEGTGTAVADSSGNGYDASVVNGAPWVSGPVGMALSFDGFSQYVLVTAGGILDTESDRTVEAWVSWSSALTGQQAIYCEGSSASDVIGLYLRDGQPVFAFLYGSPSVQELVDANALPAGGWHHVAATLGSGNGASLYVDGALVAGNAAMSAPLVSAVETDIGRSPYNGGGLYFSGSIDEVRVLTNARNASDIQMDYQNGLQGLPY